MVENLLSSRSPCTAFHAHSKAYNVVEFLPYEAICCVTKSLKNLELTELLLNGHLGKLLIFS
jgi:hypothetical protein